MEIYFNIIISVVSVIVTSLTSYSVMKWRIEQLEKKVEKHNNLIERVYKLEQKVSDLDE